MSIQWTKEWSGTDDGTIIKGTDIGTLQMDLANVLQTDDLRTLSLALLSTTSGVDATSTSKTTLYTVPEGYAAYPTLVVVRDPSASLAGGTDYDIGTGASADTWKTAVDLSGLTTASTGAMLVQPSAEFAECAAESEFGIIGVTAATAGTCTVTIDVFGYLV